MGEPVPSRRARVKGDLAHAARRLGAGSKDDGAMTGHAVLLTAVTLASQPLHCLCHKAARRTTATSPSNSSRSSVHCTQGAWGGHYGPPFGKGEEAWPVSRMS